MSPPNCELVKRDTFPSCSTFFSSPFALYITKRIDEQKSSDSSLIAVGFTSARNWNALTQFGKCSFWAFFLVFSCPWLEGSVNVPATSTCDTVCSQLDFRIVKKRLPCLKLRGTRSKLQISIAMTACFVICTSAIELLTFFPIGFCCLGYFSCLRCPPVSLHLHVAVTEYA